MRLKRVLAAAIFATAALSWTAPASATHDCETNPDHCYDCVQAPCYPEDWPPYLLKLIFGDPER